MTFTLLGSRSCSILQSAYVLHTANTIDLVIRLRSGQELGLVLQIDEVMSLRQEE